MTATLDTPVYVPVQPPHSNLGPVLFDGLLNLMAASVDDLEKVRIASENRYRTLTQEGVAVDEETGVETPWGYGLSENLPEVIRMRGILDGLSEIEKQSVSALEKQCRKHPLWTGFASSATGVGAKQFARLMAAVGDPYWNTLHNRPRTVSELWSYCGYSVNYGEAQRRRKGEKANWSADARMRVYLIAAKCVMQKRGEELADQPQFRRLYLETKLKYADATHNVDCVRCGPSGKPALAGTPLKPSHIHARALRVVSKEILKQMWIAARDYHIIHMTAV